MDCAHIVFGTNADVAMETWTNSIKCKCLFVPRCSPQLTPLSNYPLSCWWSKSSIRSSCLIFSKGFSVPAGPLEKFCLVQLFVKLNLNFGVWHEFMSLGLLCTQRSHRRRLFSKSLWSGFFYICSKHFFNSLDMGSVKMFSGHKPLQKVLIKLQI